MALDEYRASATSRSRLSRRATPTRRSAPAPGQAALLLRPEASRQPSALRLPARAQRRAALVGGAEGAVARSEDQAARDARRRSSDRVRHVRGRDPRRLRRRASSCSGTGAPGRRKSDDVDAALAKGDLKFTLDGYKLKGSWVLVRTRGYGERAAATGAAGCSSSTATSGPATSTSPTFAPLSVKSDQDFPEILAADNPDVWRTNRPAEGGETGAMLRDIIEKAAALKAGREPAPAVTRPPAATRAASAAAPKKSPRTVTARAGKSPRRSGGSK